MREGRNGAQAQEGRSSAQAQQGRSGAKEWRAGAGGGRGGAQAQEGTLRKAWLARCRSSWYLMWASRCQSVPLLGAKRYVVGVLDGRARDHHSDGCLFDEGDLVPAGTPRHPALWSNGGGVRAGPDPR